MDLSFANPAGFWALLALPIVFAIHFLQRESRRVLTSTLFLFEALRPVSAQGRRFERLRNSLPLWLQIIAAVLVTWLLAEPRWLRKDSTQRVVVVLDSSVSMLAFRAELAQTLSSRLHILARTAAKTDWRLIETDPARPTLYAGNDLNGLLAALAEWNPHLGKHVFAPALNAARSLTRDAGVAIFATDRRTELPDGVNLVAVGHAIANCGWIGVTADADSWRALVTNHSDTAQTRTWHVESDGAATADAALTLEPGQTRTLGGAFPQGKDRCELVLSGDAFPLDDRLPIVRPQPKRLAIAVQPDTALDEFLRRFAASIAQADIVPPGPAATELADVRLGIYSPEIVKKTNIFFQSQDKENPDYLIGELVTENHPLTAGLSWNGLICKRTDPIPGKDGDEILLWQGDRPLIFLRGGRADRSLIVNFDVRQSNADRLPAFVVLLNRFVESVRAEKVAFERLNVETNELLQVAGDAGQPPPHISGGDPTALRAPSVPGFFEVVQGGRALLAAAAHFADAREADFRDATTADTLAGQTSKLIEHNSRQDVFGPLFALLLGAACLANWAATGTAARQQEKGVTA